MRLLVSVASARDASAALDGGAAFIDAKNPADGPLGAVSANTFRRICRAVAGRRPVTAALGDGADEGDIEAAARRFAHAGASLVKVGFAGVASASRVHVLLAAAVRGVSQGGAGRCGVIAVAYADAAAVASLTPGVLPTIALRCCVTGVLLDTADKTGPGLRGVMTPRAIETWVAEAHANGLIVALAGQLCITDLSFARDCGADVVGVRGAACDHGRHGLVSADRVRLLRAACESSGRQTGGRSADSSAAMSSAAITTDLTCAGSTRRK